jgi:mannosyltransferase OCH1-like enzyme
MLKKITIYGERCSGTNYLEQLLINNFDIKIISHAYGFKHFFGFCNLTHIEDVLFIGIVRNLHDWLNSFYKHKYHLPESHKENIYTFLNNEFYSIDDAGKEIMEDRHIYTKERYKNIFELRHIKNKYLVEDMPKLAKNYILITYESLINNFENTMEKIRRMGLPIKCNVNFPTNSYIYGINPDKKFINYNKIEFFSRESYRNKENVYYEKLLFKDPAMENYKKNIFLFWDKDIPKIYLDHLTELQNKWKNYKIHLITDEYINQYYLLNDPEFCKIYNRISIGAAKSDIVRLLLLYEYGGLYLDIMNYPRSIFTNMDELFEKLNKKTVYFGTYAPKNISLSLILSKPNSMLIEKLYNLCKKNLIEQYTEEVTNNINKSYNLISLSGPLLLHDIIVNKPFVEWNMYLKCEENSKENKTYFEKWDCELIDLRKYFYLSYVGIHNHHGKNMDKHWSRLQLNQKLFI